MQRSKRRFEVMVVAPVVAAVVLLIGCSGGSSGTTGGSTTISGSVTDSASSPHPIVGLFDGSTYQFSSSLTASTDQVTSITGSAPYTPLETATVSGGTFTLTLPPGTSSATYYLVAWDDANGDGKLASSGEAPCFAMKSFPQGSAAVRSISFVSYAGQGEYAADYYLSGTSYIQGFSIVGTSGFNFSIQ